ncbi:FHA domain-containing protein [Occultella kanbiaonis]|uniref:FHA domain-containing protein n=1 Tax=Occultella kanbiaonis TaxID=2675754 RepID=UPI0012B8F301|nr:FHA domain-containing protein [Occultella kanbiaonis]
MGHAGEAVPARRTRAALLNGGPTLQPAPGTPRARLSLTAGAAEYLAAPADRSLWPDTWTLQRIRRDALGALARVYCGWPRTVAAAVAVLLGAGGGFFLIRGHDAITMGGLAERIIGFVLVVAAMAAGGYVLFTGLRLVAAMSAWGRIRPQDRVLTPGTLFTPAFAVRVVGAVLALAGAVVLIVRQTNPDTSLPTVGAVAVIVTGLIAGLGVLGSLLAVVLGQRAPAAPVAAAPGPGQFAPGGYAPAGPPAVADPQQWQPEPGQPAGQPGTADAPGAGAWPQQPGQSPQQGPSDPQPWAQQPHAGQPDAQPWAQQPHAGQPDAQPWAQQPQPGPPEPGVWAAPPAQQGTADQQWAQQPQPGQVPQPGQTDPQPWAQPATHPEQPGVAAWAQPPAGAAAPPAAAPAQPAADGDGPGAPVPPPSAAVPPAGPTTEDDFDDVEHTRLVHRNVPAPVREDATRAVRAAQIQVLLSDGRHLPLNATTLLGRAPQARSSEEVEGLLEVDDPAVSKTHLAVRVEGNKVWVTDRASTNGTSVKGPGGEESDLEPWEETLVPVGGEVQFGHVVLSVLLDETAG